MTDRPPHPYARRHLASHAAAGGVLGDEVLTAETLPYLDEARLSSVLRLTQADPGTALWNLLSAWRGVRHRWSWDDPDANAAALDLALMATGRQDAPRRQTASGLTWVPQWAEWLTGGTIVGSNARGTPTAKVGAIAGRPMIAVGASVEGGDGSEVRLWDAATGQLLGEPFAISGRITAVEMSAVGAAPVVVAVTHEGRIAIWDAVTHLPVHVIDVPEASFRAVALYGAGDDALIVAGGMSGHVHAYSVRTGTALGPPFGDAQPVRAVALAEVEHHLLAAVGYGDGTIERWDLRSREPLGVALFAEAEVNAVALLAEGGNTLLAAGTSDGTIWIWDAGTGETLGPSQLRLAEARAIAFGRIADSLVLAAGYMDGTVVLLDVSTGFILSEPLTHPAAVSGIGFVDVDGRPMMMTTCFDGNTRLWDPARTSVVRTNVTGRMTSVAVLEHGGDGAPIVVAGTTNARVRVWRSGNVGLRDELEVGNDPRASIEKGIPPAVEVAAGEIDGQLLLLTSYLGTVELWELNRLNSRHIRLASYRVAPDRFAPIAMHVGDGHALVATAGQGVLPPIAFDARSGATLPLDLRQVSTHLSFGFTSRPGLTLLTVTTDGGTILFDADTRYPIGPAIPTASSLNPPSTALGIIDDVEVLAMIDSGSLRLWNARTAVEWRRPIPVPSATGVAFAKVGVRDVILTSHFATVRVWNPRTGRKISELPFGTSIDAMSVLSTRAGSILVVVGGPGVVLTELRETEIASFGTSLTTPLLQ